MQFFVENLSIRSESIAGRDGNLEAWRRALVEGDLGKELEPAASPVPAMIRRRLSPLGRLALGALCDLAPRPQEPAIYASSWGDLSRSWTLLESLSATGEMSPAAFALSVHNAIGATAAIWLKDRQPFKAVCAGHLTATAGLTECALALTHAPSVLFVRYEPLMPEACQGPGIDECAPYPVAWAARLVKAPSEKTLFALDVSPLTQGQAPAEDAAEETAANAGGILGEIALLSGASAHYAEYEAMTAGMTVDAMPATHHRARRGSQWRRI